MHANGDASGLSVCMTIVEAGVFVSQRAHDEDVAVAPKVWNKLDLAALDSVVRLYLSASTVASDRAVKRPIVLDVSLCKIIS